MPEEIEIPDFDDVKEFEHVMPEMALCLSMIVGWTLGVVCGIALGMALWW